MKWGVVREADLSECLGIEPRQLGDEIVGRERALAIWRDLIRSRAFNSTVVKADTLLSADQIISFGSSVFVTPDFATQELLNPRPGLNDRLIAGLASKQSVVLADPGLVGAGAALDVVILSGNWRDEGLNPELAAEIGMLMARTFVEAHIGYGLNRVLCETKGVTQRRHFESSGGIWRTVQRFTDERTLFVMTRKEAISVVGSRAGSLFQCKAPVLHLRDTEKHLLAEALDGATDSELATRINLSASSIKKRWRSLFERIADARPDLLPDGDDRGGDGSRGPQKRHHILAYVRAHPEELRPFRWPFSGDV